MRRSAATCRQRRRRTDRAPGFLSAAERM